MIKKPGRPRVLDDSKREQVCALVSAGVSLRKSAEYVGCSHSTLCREARRDKEFHQQLRKAKGMTQLAPLEAMRQAAQSNWRAAAWMLERSDPEQFGRNLRKTFGLKELRALARDLMTIFDEEIDHPIQRERVAERVHATINYAMCHAWDTQRTGKALQKAMEYFDNKETAKETLGEVGFSLDRLAEMPVQEAETEETFATREGSSLAKLKRFCNTTKVQKTVEQGAKETAGCKTSKVLPQKNGGSLHTRAFQ